MPAVKSQARVSDPILGAALIAAIFGSVVCCIVVSCLLFFLKPFNLQ